MKKTIYIASDHGGYKTKEAIQKMLEKKGYTSIDLGAHDEESVDYPDFACKVAEKVASHKNSLGVLVCGTGIGMSIAANKVYGIRAANPFDEYTARMAREHNNANIVCVGGRTYSKERAKKIVDAFLKAVPSREKRHVKRVKKISAIEKKGR